MCRWKRDEGFCRFEESAAPWSTSQLRVLPWLVDNVGGCQRGNSGHRVCGGHYSPTPVTQRFLQLLHVPWRH